MKNQKRGELTERVSKKAKDMLGREITRVELRLMPYIHYRANNEQTIDMERVNDDEISIMSKWEAAGWMKLDRRSSRPRLTITKKFYDAMNEILWLAYVDVDK